MGIKNIKLSSKALRFIVSAVEHEILTLENTLRLVKRRRLRGSQIDPINAEASIGNDLAFLRNILSDLRK